MLDNGSSIVRWQHTLFPIALSVAIACFVSIWYHYSSTRSILGDESRFNFNHLTHYPQNKHWFSSNLSKLPSILWLYFQPSIKFNINNKQFQVKYHKIKVWIQNWSWLDCKIYRIFCTNAWIKKIFILIRDLVNIDLVVIIIFEPLLYTI